MRIFFSKKEYRRALKYGKAYFASIEFREKMPAMAEALERRSETVSKSSFL